MSLLQIAEQRLAALKEQVSEARSRVIGQETVRLEAENAQLRKDVAELQRQYEASLSANGKRLFTAETPPTRQPIANDSQDKAKSQSDGGKEKGDKKAKKEKTATPNNPSAPKEEEKVDVSRLDLRVGLISEASIHPDADGLYVEKVFLGASLGERTVCSGLVKWMPASELQGRLAVLLCNLKPAKMRGVSSEAMVMCASSDTLVELLDPPPGAEPGDRVGCKEYPGDPDTPHMNPKKKIFEKIQPELRVDGHGVVRFRDAPLEVPGKGLLTSKTARNSAVK